MPYLQFEGMTTAPDHDTPAAADIRAREAADTPISLSEQRML